MSSTTAASSGFLANTRKSVDALLADIGGLLADLTSQDHPAADEENDEARHVIDVELQRFWEGYYELKQRHEANALSVAVLALTKSGKSTLLNALMGMEVLPMNNVPETARMCRITHNAASREPLLHDAAGKTLKYGEVEVRSCLQQLNRAARTNNGPGDDSGSNGGVFGGPSSVLHMSAPLVALEGFGPEFGRVTLLDTPGPNEAGEEQLKHQVERLLEGVDCVLYLLDYTKLKTAEEEGLFRRLRTINPQLVARLSSRLFFVINKVDTSETSEGLDPDEVRSYVADLVTRQLGSAVARATAVTPGSPRFRSSVASATHPTPERSGPGGASLAAAPGVSDSSATGTCTPAAEAPFHLRPDQVLLLSGRNALLARLVLSGRASPETMKRFMRVAFGTFGGAGPSGPSGEQVRAAAGCMLAGSGILELEGRVMNFLAAHAASVKLLATADDLIGLLAKVRNVALTCRSCLQRNVEVLQEQAKGLHHELEGAKIAFEEVKTQTNAVQAEMVSEIKVQLNTLRRRLFTHIVQSLDTDARAPAPNPSPASTSAGCNPTSRWNRVRMKFLSMFTTSCSTLPSQPQGAGPSLVPEARNRTREELQALLLDLHDDLMGQIHSEVYDFWGVLEAVAASRNTELLRVLNIHLVELSRRVEGAVSEALEVELVAADIRLRPPSAEQLHSDVEELIKKGIRESTEKHIRVGARTTKERVFRHHEGPPSLCRWGGYWVEVPRTRTVVETYTATVYSLRPDEIINHFTGLVDGAVNASEKALGSYVGALVQQQLAAAKEQICEYGNRYLRVMEAALAASSKGTECRSSALASVEVYLSRLNELLARAQTVQRNAEAAVPGGAAGLMDEVQVYEDEELDGSRVGDMDGQVYSLSQQGGEFLSAYEGAGRDGGASDAVEVHQENPVEVEAEEIQHVGYEAEVEAVSAEQATPCRSCSSSSSISDIDDLLEVVDVTPAPGSGPPDHGVKSEGACDCEVLNTASVVLPLGEDVAPSLDGGTAPDVEAACLHHFAAVDAMLITAAADSAVVPAKNETPSTQVQDQRPSSSLLVAAGTFLATGASQLLSGSQMLTTSAVCTQSSYAGTPFDYTRAFLEAMSSSEMAIGAGQDEPLTMIPLTGDGEGEVGAEGVAIYARQVPPFGDVHGIDTPCSGASEEWHLVGEDALETLEDTQVAGSQK